MRMTAHKKEILTYFEPDNLKWVTDEIGPPPLDVSGFAYLLYGMELFKKHHLESIRQTLEAMVSLIATITVYLVVRHSYAILVESVELLKARFF